MHASQNKEHSVFNTMYDVAFSLEHNHLEPGDVPVERLIEALERRVAELKAMSPAEASEAFGVCDTYEIQSP